MIPHSVLLDTHEVVKRLRELPSVDSFMIWRLYLPEVLEEIVESLRNVKTARRDLRALCRDIQQRKRYATFFPDTPNLLAAGVEEVGMKIFEQLKLFGAYLPDGSLPFYCYKVEDPLFNDILLVREEQLPGPAP